MNLPFKNIKVVIVVLMIGRAAGLVGAASVESYENLSSRLNKESDAIFLNSRIKMFVKPTDASKNPIAYTQWNTLFSDINAYVQKNNTDLLGRSDKDILNSWDSIIKANNTIMSIIRAAYDNFFTQNKGGQESVTKLVEIDTIVGGLLSNEKMKLQKKRKSLTLDKKKKTVDLMLQLVDVLEKIYKKAQSDSTTQMWAAFDKAAQ